MLHKYTATQEQIKYANDMQTVFRANSRRSYDKFTAFSAGNRQVIEALLFRNILQQSNNKLKNVWIFLAKQHIVIIFDEINV